MEGWEQVNGAELYKDQRPALKYSNPDIREDGSNSDDSQRMRYPVLVSSPESEAQQMSAQPSGPPSETQDWETIDSKEFQDRQASAPTLPMGIQLLPQRNVVLPSTCSESESASMGLQTLPIRSAAPTAACCKEVAPVHRDAALAADCSKGEPHPIQMQGFNALDKAPKGPVQADSVAREGIPESSVLANSAVKAGGEQAANAPADSGPLPLSSSPASYCEQGQATRMPRVLRKLQAGDRLRTGDKLESSNGLSTAVLQDDGNFVVYTRKSLLMKASRVKWSTGTYDRNPNRFLKGHELCAQVCAIKFADEGNHNRFLKGHELCAQEDGNLVLYTKDSKVAWASNTDIKSSDAYTFEVTDSGTLVWYCETTGEEVWTSKLCGG